MSYRASHTLSAPVVVHYVTGNQNFSSQLIGNQTVVLPEPAANSAITVNSSQGHSAHVFHIQGKRNLTIQYDGNNIQAQESDWAWLFKDLFILNFHFFLSWTLDIQTNCKIVKMVSA